MRRPNIVYLTGDCLKASATTPGGSRVGSMPFMDRMAAQGIAFTNAYAPNPICTPSRCSVMTGVHPLVHQVTCHQNRAPLNLKQLPEFLHDAGYYTGVCGHYEFNRDLNRGYHEQVDEAAPGRLREAYLAWQQSGRRDIGWPSGTLPRSAEESHSHLVTDRATLMLDSAKATGKPFFLHVSYNDPHTPCFAPAPYDTLVDPATVDLPLVGNDEERPPWHAAALAVFRTAEATEADIRRFVATYYGMVAHLDHQMQRLHDALADRDMLRHTWFIIASDHGAYTGEKGMFSHTESLYECLLHVPLVIVPPKVDASLERGTTTDQLVDLVDLFPTILGMAGLPCPAYAQGHDLLPWVREGAARPLRDCVFAQVGDYQGNLGDTLPGGRPKCTRHAGLLQGVRTRDFSYVRDPDFGDEAYDLRADPYELHNLLNPGAPPAPPQIGDLKRGMADWEQGCLQLREELGVIPGFRGFAAGWE